MFRKIKQAREVIKQVLSRRNYFLLFIFSSILIFSIFYILTLATTTNQSLGIFIMMNGGTYAISTFFLLFVIAILFGIYFSLLAYTIRARCKKKRILGEVSGAGGFIIGLFSAGCPMCGAFLFGLFGFPLALFFMPFKGLELRVLAILLLSISIYFTSRGLIECKIKR